MPYYGSFSYEVIRSIKTRKLMLSARMADVAMEACRTNNWGDDVPDEKEQPVKDINIDTIVKAASEQIADEKTDACDRELIVKGRINHLEDDDNGNKMVIIGQNDNMQSLGVLVYAMDEVSKKQFEQAFANGKRAVISIKIV